MDWKYQEFKLEYAKNERKAWINIDEKRIRREYFPKMNFEVCKEFPAPTRKKEPSASISKWKFIVVNRDYYISHLSGSHHNLSFCGMEVVDIFWITACSFKNWFFCLSIFW